MPWLSTIITLAPRSRGFHLITQEILDQFPKLTSLKIGMCHIFIQHTSASLTINENASPEVLLDMEDHMNHLVPENMPFFRHTYEGSDDMPAHVKSSLMGASVLLPIRDGRLALGTWQGVYLCEHRNRGGSRKLVVTAWGE